MKKISKRLTSDEGASMAEYGLLITGIAAIAVGAVFALGEKVSPLYEAVLPWFS